MMHGLKVAGRNTAVVIIVIMVQFIVYCHYYMHAEFVSNDEFNCSWTKGYTRAQSVLQVWTDVRKKYNKLKKTTLLCMLTLSKVNKIVSIIKHFDNNYFHPLPF